MESPCEKQHWWFVVKGHLYECLACGIRRVIK